MIDRYIKEKKLASGYFLPRYSRDYTEKSLQRVGLLHIRLVVLRDLNYQTPFYADFISKYLENRYTIHFSVNNSCNFKAISKSSISKQIT